MTYRVIQWSTGNVGRLALRAIIEHPDLELVGLWVHSADKVGRDAGELAGVGPTGVLATNDVDALLALDADVVSHNATGDLRPQEAVAEMCRFLESGKNVVSSSVVSLLYPPSADPRVVARLEQACTTGNASLFTSGIDPGFANDLLPLTLAGFCEEIESLRVQEILNYATYDQPEVLFETMGFGKPLDETPMLLQPGVLSLAWGSVVRQLAAGLGVSLDEVSETYIREPAPEDFDIASGQIPKGSAAALRFEVRGMVDGKAAVILEHVTRLRDDLCPDWPQPAQEGGSYRIEITGEPTYAMDLCLSSPNGDHNHAGLVATASRVVNAIPAVIAAPPGVRTTLDLPLITGNGLYAGGKSG